MALEGSQVFFLASSGRVALHCGMEVPQAEAAAASQHFDLDLF